MLKLEELIMKKVIIVPSNTDLNRGDQALVWESINLIEDACGKENVSCYLMTDLDSKDSLMQNRQTEKLGYSFINTIVKHPGRNFKTKNEDSRGYTMSTKILWGLRAILDYLHTRPLLSEIRVVRLLGEIFLSQSEQKSLSAIKTCDAVFVKGGGFIHSFGAITDSYLIYYLTYNIRLASVYGKKIIMLPISIGPLNNIISRSIAVKALKKCSFISVRENISKDFLKSLNIGSEFYPDLGFFLKPSNKDMEGYLANKGVPVNQKKVILTLRPYRFQGYANGNELYNNYLNGMANLVIYLVQEEYHVTFMAHTLGPSSHEDDRIAIMEVMNTLPETVRNHISYIEDYDLNCKDVEKIYSYYDYMVGTRFHSVIFSLNVGVPSIAVAYGGNKSKGIMSVIGNGDFSIDIDKVVDNELIKMFKKLESSQDYYRNNLNEKKKEIDLQREVLINKINRVLEG